MAGALILLAGLGPADFAWLEALRRRHYPPDRNRVPAHLTIFHALPPSAEVEVRGSLSRIAASPPPRATACAVMDLGGGVAIRIRSDDLDCVREELRAEFHGLLSAPDRGGWIPHITIQNKVEPAAARALRRSLEKDFRPRPIQIGGLQLIRYCEKDWEPVADYRFRGVS